ASFHSDPEKFIRRHAARISDLARESIVRTPAWFDRRPFGPAHHEGYTTIANWSPHGEQHAKRAPVEPRGRGSLPVPHVHPP
ncbi:MAG: hypothetical protein Q8R02_09190, partial [Hyphomonadaceae bacterium]|nr:hypothetical protein [Hyphomonadaceae bacterium]